MSIYQPSIFLINISKKAHLFTLLLLPQLHLFSLLSYGLFKQLSVIHVHEELHRTVGKTFEHIHSVRLVEFNWGYSVRCDGSENEKVKVLDFNLSALM